MHRRFVLFMVLSVMWVWPIAAQDLPTCDLDSPLQHGEPTLNPTERYTLYMDCYTPDQSRVTVYAYDDETGDTLILGQTADDLDTEYLYLSRWLDDTRAELRAETGGGTYNWRSVYLADVTMADSLTEVARDYVARPRFGEHPPRYEWSVEDGLTETFTVYRYDVETDETQALYSAPCDLRDDLQNALSCHMVTPTTNADFTDEGDSTRLLMNMGDSIKEVKTIEVRAVPDGDLLYTVDALAMGYGDWLSADTFAVFNLAFDFELAGFAGKFIQLDENGDIINEQPFTLANGAELTERPTWLDED